MDNNEFVDFSVTAGTYKTLLTKKYLSREVWHKPFPGDVISHLPGTILKVNVEVGQMVNKGDLLLMHEAMKMQNRVISPVSGIVTEIFVSEGEKISKNHLMLKIDPK